MPNPNYKCENGVISIKINDKWIQPSFDEYEDIEPIGEPGANGVVVKAIHKTTKRLDAIKIWLPRMRRGKNKIRKEQYEAEVQKIAKLNDSRIATIYDAWQEKDCYCCSMEYINGITYEKWLKRNHNKNRRIEMLLKIFEAIIYYQSKGIIHGDIHSKNILIDCEDKIHIIDFGTSSLSSYEEQSKYRENYIMYDLVEKTLEENFDKNVFMYRKYSIDEDIINEKDVRNATPLFFSQSVKSYLHLFKLLEVCKDIINNPEALYDYCRNIARGHYLNLDYFCMKITSENDYELEVFSKVMYECLEDEVYENAQNNPDEAEIVTFLSLYVYYDLVKFWILNGDINESMFTNKVLFENLDNSERITKLFMESGDLLIFHDNLLKIKESPENANFIEESLRASLLDIIVDKSGRKFLYILRNINLQISELRQNEELFERIIKLSSFR